MTLASVSSRVQDQRHYNLFTFSKHLESINSHFNSYTITQAHVPHVCWSAFTCVALCESLQTQAELMTKAFAKAFMLHFYNRRCTVKGGSRKGHWPLNLFTVTRIANSVYISLSTTIRASISVLVN